MSRQKTDPWSVEIVGQADGPWSGAKPDSLEKLIEKPDKDVKSLKYQVLKAAVELACQSGNLEEAADAIKRYEEFEFSYACPLNRFQRDKQHGDRPYIGAHCVFGAIRDAAKESFNDFFQFYAKKGDKGPSDKHFRKYVDVRPHHIFLYRPDVGGEVVQSPDEIDGQQPTVDVRGFARYEIINPPFQFKFRVNFRPYGHFESRLSDRDMVRKAIYQAVNHGLGGRRGVGFGMWSIVDYKEIV
ncbi:MAG: hypothetical protein ACTSX6_08180 [Candidatus Heimdallarchaeaceae archaeon]